MPEDAWVRALRRVAKKFGVRLYVQPAAFLAPKYASLSVRIDGVTVNVDATVPPVGDPIGSKGITRLLATVPGAGPLRLKIKRGHVYPIGRAFGIQDERTGDEVFDDRFVVKTNSLSLALAWLDEPIRALMLRAEDYRFTLSKMRVEAVLRVYHSDSVHGALEAAIRTVASIAGRAERAAASWRALAVKLGGTHVKREPDGQPFDGLAMQVEHEGARVHLDLWFGRAGKRGPRRLFTRARCRRAPGDEREFRWQHDDPPPAWLDRRTRELFLAAALDAAFTDGEHVTLLAEGLLSHVDDGRRLIALAAALAAGGGVPAAGGPYR